MKWKQAVGYFFIHNTVATYNLAVFITDCIQRDEKCGLFVRCIVCDQGPTNVAALRQLGYNEKSSTYVKVNSVDRRIFVIFDPPHLIKNVRNNLQRHDIQVGEDITSWKNIDAFYQLDKSCAIR